MLKLMSLTHGGYPVSHTKVSYRRQSRRSPAIARPWLADDEVADYVVRQLGRIASIGQAEVSAYCVMRDHVHALLTGTSERSHLPTTVRTWKQATGYWFASRSRRRLWQKNFWDVLLRTDDDVWRQTRYIVRNPVAGGVTSGLRTYRWIGSDRWSRDDLI